MITNSPTIAKDLFGKEIHIGDWIAYPVGEKTKYKAKIRIARVFDISSDGVPWSTLKVKGIRYFGEKAEITKLTKTRSSHKGIVLDEKMIPLKYRQLIKLSTSSITKALKK